MLYWTSLVIDVPHAINARPQVSCLPAEYIARKVEPANNRGQHSLTHVFSFVKRQRERSRLSIYVRMVDQSETATYNSLVLGAIRDWTQAEHPIGSTADRQPAAYNRIEPTARVRQDTAAA
jgi:hypothetical protein